MSKELLTGSDHWFLEKNIIKEFGIETALLLSDLAETKEKNSDDDGWFCRTSYKLEEFTGLSKHKQSKIINNLINHGILIQKNKGVPMKRFFKFKGGN